MFIYKALLQRWIASLCSLIELKHSTYSVWSLAVPLIHPEFLKTAAYKWEKVKKNCIMGCFLVCLSQVLCVLFVHG